MRLKLLVLTKSLGPNALLSRGKDAVGIKGVFDRLDETLICVVIEVVQACYEV